MSRIIVSSCYEFLDSSAGAIDVLHTGIPIPCIGSNWLKPSKLSKQSLIIFHLKDQTLHVMKMKWDTKKDTKAKHVVSYTATTNLLKFLALTNLPAVQCFNYLHCLSCTRFHVLQKIEDHFSLLQQTPEKIDFSKNGNFYLWKHPSSIGDIFGFMSTTGGALLQSCFNAGGSLGAVATPGIIILLFCYQSVLCDTSYVLCSIMHDPRPLLTIQVSHHYLCSTLSFWSSVIVLPFSAPPPKSPTTPLHP